MANPIQILEMIKAQLKEDPKLDLHALLISQDIYLTDGQQAEVRREAVKYRKQLRGTG